MPQLDLIWFFYHFVMAWAVFSVVVYSSLSQSYFPVLGFTRRKDIKQIWEWRLWNYYF
uniref:ATP synthase F0 subunit 8 n=1 Tax=Chiridota heheva TaxID=2743191 RepID=A0A8E5JZD8_9ECHN|nr:ATP synthase F0 subunit 8 [Chiridota heheva]QVD42791.1 ATP synthase F0 subunit 8 [Chiridota heheva]